MKKNVLIIAALLCLLCCIASADSAGWICPVCGSTVTTPYCPYDAQPIPETSAGWICSLCRNVCSRKFCERDGQPSPALWLCPTCGSENTGDSCSLCYRKDPNGTVGLSSFARPGMSVYFGTYQQDQYGTRPIEWTLLQVQGNKALLLSRYVLDAGVQYHQNGYTTVTWENCDMRTWLNEYFFRTAFSDAERSVILRTFVDNRPSQGKSGWLQDPCAVTADRVFLLSCAEAVRYMPTPALRMTTPTAYAVSRGVYVNPNTKCASWWMRSQGSKQSYMAHDKSDGTIECSRASLSMGGIRPAIWVRIGN